MSFRTNMKRIASIFIKSKSVYLSDMVLTGAFQDYGVLKAIAKKPHEPMFQKLFTDTVKEGVTVVDVGAHLGKYSLLEALGKMVASCRLNLTPAPFSFWKEMWKEIVFGTLFKHTIWPLANPMA